MKSNTFSTFWILQMKIEYGNPSVGASEVESTKLHIGPTMQTTKLRS